MQKSIFKYCPNCSSKDFLFPNNRKFTCNVCRFTYFHNVAAAVAVVFVFENKILFTQRNQTPKKGMLDLPGGFVDFQETAEQAAKREIKEELDWDIPIDQFNYFVSFPNEYEYQSIIYHTEDLAFIVELDEIPFTNANTEEIEKIMWIDKNSINLDKIAFKSIQNILKRYAETH